MSSSPILRVNAAIYASAVGFTGESLAIAVALAYAESSCIPTAYNSEAAFFEKRGYVHPADTGEGSKGLWQIFEFEHPEFAGWNLFDPQINACAMAMVWYRAGKSFNPWSTYRVQPPAYQSHLAQAQTDVAALVAG